MFKIFNTSCLLKRPGQTEKTQIRRLLQKSLIMVIPVCFSEKHFVNSSPDIPSFYLRTEREKCLKF